MPAYLSTAPILRDNPQTLHAARNVISASAAITSFEMSYGNSDHHVVKVGTGVNAQASKETITIYGSTHMIDSSGHVAACKHLGAGVLASLIDDPGYGIRVAGGST